VTKQSYDFFPVLSTFAYPALPEQAYYSGYIGYIDTYTDAYFDGENLVRPIPYFVVSRSMPIAIPRKKLLDFVYTSQISQFSIFFFSIDK
jgi:hypothetical protein